MSSNKDTHLLDSRPLRSKPVFSNDPHRIRRNSDFRSVKTNRAGPRAHSTSPHVDSNSEVPLGQTWNSGSTRPNQFPADASNKVLVLRPQEMHLSARRGEFRDYPEYHDYTFPPSTLDQAGIPSAELRGGFLDQKKPLNAHVSNEKSLNEPGKTSFEQASSIPNPPKIASDDARVLELQEVNRGPGAFFRATQKFTATQSPLQAPSQVAPLVEGQFSISSNLTQPVFDQDRSDYTLSNDPAVVFVGDKAGNGTYSDYHLQKQKEIQFLRRNMQHRDESRRPRRQKPYTSGEDQLSANAHFAGMNYQSFPADKGRNLPISEPFQYFSTQDKQAASLRSDIPSHQPFPFSINRKRPVETGRWDHSRPRLYDEGERKLYIGNVPAKLTQDMIAALFDPEVKISSVTNVLTKNPRDDVGFAFVT